MLFASFLKESMITGDRDRCSHGIIKQNENLLTEKSIKTYSYGSIKTMFYRLSNHSHPYHMLKSQELDKNLITCMCIAWLFTFQFQLKSIKSGRLFISVLSTSLNSFTNIFVFLFNRVCHKNFIFIFKAGFFVCRSWGNAIEDKGMSK